jgi:hypothetical protein
VQEGGSEETPGVAASMSGRSLAANSVRLQDCRSGGCPAPPRPGGGDGARREGDRPPPAKRKTAPGWRPRKAFSRKTSSAGWPYEGVPAGGGQIAVGDRSRYQGLGGEAHPGPKVMPDPGGSMAARPAVTASHHRLPVALNGSPRRESRSGLRLLGELARSSATPHGLDRGHPPPNAPRLVAAGGGISRRGALRQRVRRGR